MKHFVRKIIKTVISLVFVGAFVWVSGQLFFAEEVGQLMHYFDEKVSEGVKMDVLSLAYFEDASTLEPTVALPQTRSRLVNLYESLVRPDADLNMQSALAVSWGLIDDNTWEFNLRPGVVFHDGSEFTSSDAVVSIDRAQNWPKSELKALMDNIVNVEVIDDLTMRIYTAKPDPLLLQKLSSVFVIPEEYAGKEIPVPVGTGSYVFSDWQEGESMTFSRNQNYWGHISKFSSVQMIVEFDKSERVALLVNGDVDLLTTVPFDAADYIEGQGFNIAAVPSLEVAFLMFNVNSDLLSDVDKRHAVSASLDVENFVSKLGRFAKPLSQYVSNGIFGYNPRIADHSFDLDSASELAANVGLKGKTLQFHLPKELSILGEFVRTSLDQIDVPVVVSYMELSDYYNELYDGKADIYYIGFKADLGDAGDFFNGVTHTDGNFNFIHYSSDLVDELTESAFYEMDQVRRRGLLQELMEIVVDSDVIGVPMYEYETVFAFNNAIDFVPRIDGIVYFDEINIK